VAASLNPEVFEVEVYSFDTRAYKIPKINNSYRILGGGGTDFNCIEKSVEQDNPDVVFVVTDGFASSFVPKDKKKYFWFLVEGGSEAAIRGAGKIHRLSQFE
jgi:predicted metal-dependent peptidase